MVAEMADDAANASSKSADAEDLTAQLTNAGILMTRCDDGTDGTAILFILYLPFF